MAMHPLLPDDASSRAYQVTVDDDGRERSFQVVVTLVNKVRNKASNIPSGVFFNVGGSCHKYRYSTSEYHTFTVIIACDLQLAAQKDGL